MNLATTLPTAWSIIEDGINAGLHSGGQIYVSKAGQIVVDAAFGIRQPGFLMQPDNWMPWLSNTKPFMAVAFGQLIENDVLSLSDPVVGWIPEFAAGGKEAITIEHLLTHTGGFRGADKIPENLPWPATIERICATPLEDDWIPGETAGYHISGSWFVLGEILRRATGMELTAYFRQFIFTPLGMEHSFLSLAHEDLKRAEDRIAPMFMTMGGKSELHPALNSTGGLLTPRPGSSGRGPIHELARLYEMLLADGIGQRGKVLAPRTVRLITARRRIGRFDRTFRQTIDWGLGLIVNSNQYGVETAPYSFGRHASPESFGHGGAQSSSAFADPSHQLVVAWAFNGMPGEARHHRRGRELNTAIYDDLRLAPA